ncbi:MAG: hypothetical protein GY893_09330 [bacterium]|nr:hypothetical protein [bacterium]
MESLETLQNPPLPEGFGWTSDGERAWKPMWTHLPEAAKVCRELLRCG